MKRTKTRLIPLPAGLIILRLRHLLQVRIVVLVIPIPVTRVEVMLVLLVVLVPYHLDESRLRVLFLFQFVGPDHHISTELVGLEGEEAKARRDDRLVRDVCDLGREAHRFYRRSIVARGAALSRVCRCCFSEVSGSD